MSRCSYKDLIGSHQCFSHNGRHRIQDDNDIVQMYHLKGYNEHFQFNPRGSLGSYITLINHICKTQVKKHVELMDY